MVVASHFNETYKRTDLENLIVNFVLRRRDWKLICTIGYSGNFKLVEQCQFSSMLKNWGFVLWMPFHFQTIWLKEKFHANGKNYSWFCWYEPSIYLGLNSGEGKWTTLSIKCFLFYNLQNLEPGTLFKRN